MRPAIPAEAALRPVPVAFRAATPRVAARLEAVWLREALLQEAARQQAARQQTDQVGPPELPAALMPEPAPGVEAARRAARLQAAGVCLRKAPCSQVAWRDAPPMPTPGPSGGAWSSKTSR